ncbi:MAG: hypothetical protein M1376_09505 [Planctomycetes bacterium]|nr:hypothetical protein [Planctomycetota bacterium]
MMSLMHVHTEQPNSAMTPRVSLRTLILMLELLVAVVACQYVRTAEPIQARAIWLAGDGHTAATVREQRAEPALTVPAPAPAGEGAGQP